MLEASIELDCNPALVAVARTFVDRVIREWELDPIRDDARLITTELASNAVLHARTEFCITLKSDGFGFLRIEVRDLNSRLPSLTWAPEGATSGRGLAVVSAMAAAWGSAPDGDGKIVWAEIGSAPESGRDGDDDADSRDFASSSR